MASIQERRGELEQGDAEVEDSSDRDSASVAYINSRLDSRKAKFHPQKADIVSSDFQSSSLVDKVVAALACDCGSDRASAEEVLQEGTSAPIEGLSTQHNQGVYGASEAPWPPEITRAAVEDPEARSIVDEASGLGEEVEQEDSKASEEPMAHVPGTQDESSRLSPLEKIKEKLKEKQEHMQLKGEKGIEDDPHPELTSVRQEPTFDYKVSAEEGAAEEHRNPLEKLKDKLNHKKEELKLRGEKDVEEDPHPELTSVRQEPNFDYKVSAEEGAAEEHRNPLEKLEDKLKHKQEEVKLRGEKGVEEDPHPELKSVSQEPDFDYKVSAEEGAEEHSNPLEKLEDKLEHKQEEPKLIGEEGVEEDPRPHSEPAHVNIEPNRDYVMDEHKGVEEDPHSELAHVSIEPNPDYVIDEEQQEFADAPLSFQPTQEKNGEEKEFVDAPLSFQQDEKSTDGRAIYDVTPPEDEESNPGYDTNNPTAEEAFSGKLGKEGSSSSSSSDEEESPASLENTQEKSSSDENVAGEDSNSIDESKPGFFSKVKQSIWKSSSDRKDEEGHKDGDSELEKHEPSISSPFENEPIPTSQQAHEESNVAKASNTSSPDVKDESGPSFLSKVKQTLWKSDTKKDEDEREEDDDAYIQELDGQSSLSSAASDKEPSPTFQQAGEKTAGEESGDMVSPNVEDESKPSLFSKVKQTLWKTDSKTQNAEPAGDLSKGEGTTPKDLERKGSSSSSSSGEEVKASNPTLEMNPRDGKCEEVLDELLNTDTGDVSVRGEETTVIPSVSIAWDEGDVKSPAKLTDKEESDVGEALQDKLTLDEQPEDVGTQHTELTSNEKLEQEPSSSLQNKKWAKSRGHSSIGEEEGSGFLGRIASKIGYSTSPTAHGRSQST